MEDGNETRGLLALVGGGEWRGDDALDRELLERGDGEVLVLPTAAAYERPEAAIAQASAWFGSLGGRVRPCMVLSRSDAEDEARAAEVAAARCIYLCGGSPLHLRSVLKDSRVLDALFGAWSGGAAVVGSSAGAMALTDPMVDPRGGAFTVGLGLVRNVAVVPHFAGEVTPQLRRTLSLSPSGCAIVALGEQCAIVREPEGTWRGFGSQIAIYEEGKSAGLESLAGKPID